MLGAAGGIAAVKIRDRIGRPVMPDRREKETEKEKEPVYDYML